MDVLFLKQFFTFATELEKLKKLERYKGQYYWRDYPELARYESVADHTWRLGMLVVMFADRLTQKINLEKALKMVLVHDVPEIVAGDDSPMGEDGSGKNTYAFDGDKAQTRHLREKDAAKTLFALLPPEDAQAFLDLWLEYDLQTSFEAKASKPWTN